MESWPREILHYCTSAGAIPFQIWFRNLKDLGAKAKVEERLERIEAGNFGNCNFVGNGVFEIKINCGAPLKTPV